MEHPYTHLISGIQPDHPRHHQTSSRTGASSTATCIRTSSTWRSPCSLSGWRSTWLSPVALSRSVRGAAGWFRTTRNSISAVLSWLWGTGGAGLLTFGWQRPRPWQPFRHKLVGLPDFAGLTGGAVLIAVLLSRRVPAEAPQGDALPARRRATWTLPTSRSGPGWRLYSLSQHFYPSASWPGWPCSPTSRSS